MACGARWRGAFPGAKSPSPKRPSPQCASPSASGPNSSPRRMAGRFSKWLKSTAIPSTRLTAPRERPWPFSGETQGCRAYGPPHPRLGPPHAGIFGASPLRRAASDATAPRTRGLTSSKRNTPATGPTDSRRETCAGFIRFRCPAKRTPPRFDRVSLTSVQDLAVDGALPGPGLAVDPVDVRGMLRRAQAHIQDQGVPGVPSQFPRENV